MDGSSTGRLRFQSGLCKPSNGVFMSSAPAEQVLTKFIWEDWHSINVAIELRDPVTADAVASTGAGDGD